MENRDLQRMFGQFAVLLGLADKEAVKRARHRQEEIEAQGRPIHLGEVMVELGIIDDDTRHLILVSQESARVEGPADLLFGSLAVLNGFITREQLERRISEQGEAGADAPRLGRLLVQTGDITEADRRAILKTQKRLLAKLGT